MASAPEISPAEGATRRKLAVGRDGIAYAYADRRHGEVELRQLGTARADGERWPELHVRLQRVVALRDPALLGVHGCDLDGAVPWILLEQPPRTLLDEIRSGPVAIERALEITRAVGGALEVAHDAGVVHGCLCPGHVRLRADGSPAIDLTGIATGDSAALGGLELCCRAPEAASTAASDVYGLAALLWTMISGAAGGSPSPTEAPGRPWLAALTAAMLAAAPEERPPLSRLLAHFGDSVAGVTVKFRRSAVRPTNGADGVADTVAESATIAGSARAPATGEESTAAGSAPAPAPAPGDRIGRFRLVQLLGQGGMGQVYRAEDETSGETVALKLLHPWASDEMSLRRFDREARLLGRVDSPHVARLREWRADDHHRHLVMDFLEGDTLQHLIKRDGPIPEERAVEIAADIARGLADIHSVGIVHRDVKPANVILVDRSDGDPAAVLCDLGVARSFGPGSDAAITRTGIFVGTPEYVAPEQCLGRDVDERADVYSLGATLYAMLTGRPPLEGADLGAIVSAHLEAKPLDRATLESVSEPVVRIVCRALETTPERRFGDARELLEELERVRRGEQPTRVDGHPRPLPGDDEQDLQTYIVELELDASPEELWPFVGNTDRLNRAIGLGAVEVSRRRDGDRVHTFGRSRILGFDLEWREHNFEWIEPYRFGVLREFFRGPLRWYRSSVSLERLPGGRTRLHHRIDAVPRGLVGKAAAALEVGLRTRRALTRVYRRIERVLAASRGRSPHDPDAPDAMPASIGDPFEPMHRLTAAADHRLSAIEARLLAEGCDSRAVDRLGEWLRGAPGQELARVRPRALARRFGVETTAMLDTMLHATRAGALVLSWEVLCPMCQNPSGRASALDEVGSHAECEGCGIGFESDFARSIELVFQSHPAIRRADEATYCISGGPANAPHVVAQVRLARGERFHADVALASGAYRVVCPELRRQVGFRVDAAAALARVEISLSAGIAPDRPRSVATGAQHLVLTNDSETEVTVRVERQVEDTDAFTAAEAACRPEFLRLFPEQVLSPRTLVGISHVVVLVAGLLAEQVEGIDEDAWPVYRALSELRIAVEEAAALEGGTVVRLHEDGVLAVFSESVAATRCGLALLRGGQPTRLAAQAGSAMVTTVNRRLDYFGKPVTCATELVAGSLGGELRLGEEIVREPDVVDLLLPPDVDVELGGDPPRWARVTLGAPDGGAGASAQRRGEGDSG